jgi:hypothetical protein
MKKAAQASNSKWGDPQIIELKKVLSDATLRALALNTPKAIYEQSNLFKVVKFETFKRKIKNMLEDKEFSLQGISSNS